MAIREATRIIFRYFSAKGKRVIAAGGGFRGYGRGIEALFIVLAARFRIAVDKGGLKMTESYRKCSHCKGTGKCRNCHGTGRLALQKGKVCTSCYPHGSGNCQNCRGLGGFDAAGNPAKPNED